MIAYNSFTSRLNRLDIFVKDSRTILLESQRKIIHISLANSFITILDEDIKQQFNEVYDSVNKIYTLIIEGVKYFYNIKVITELEKNKRYLLTTDRWTKSSIFMLPLLGQLAHNLNNPWFYNAYIYKKNGECTLDDGCLILSYRYFNVPNFLSFERFLLKLPNIVHIFETTGFTHVVIRLPDNLEKDFEAFKTGQYTKFSKSTKKDILAFYKNSTAMYDILYATEQRRKQLELDLQHYVNTTELFDILDKNEETLFI